MPPVPAPGFVPTMRRYWKETLACYGFRATARSFVHNLWDFLRESTPAQRRLRYGDAEFDWDFRVDTTRATVGWRERLLGHFHCSYQATELAAFTEMMASLKIDFQQFTFVDIGSGKGRVLLMAANYPFRRILGVELLPALHRVAQENLIGFKSESQKCFALESLCCDAREFVFPAEPMVLFLFNPLLEREMIEVVANLDHSLRENQRPVYVVYHNPVLEYVLAENPAFQKIAGTHQYSIFQAGG